MGAWLSSCIVVLLAAWFTWPWIKTPHELPRERVEFTTMGTVAGITFVGEVDNRITAQVQTEFAELDALLSAWCPTSELSRVASVITSNNLHLVSERVRPLYAQAFQLQAQSGNAFNPYLGKVMRKWGFAHGGHFSDFDLGAIAKGFAVDQAWVRLQREQGQTSLLLDLGGNLRVVGTATWRTGVRNPFRSNEYAAIFTLSNGEATATSGNYERFVMREGKRVSHIFDGRTGKNVQGVASVTVIAPTATLADGLSTTLFVLGPVEGQKFLDRYYPGTAALWIADDPPDLHCTATEAMRRRLQP